MNKPGNTFVSVIIPTLNDSERLQLCLFALEQQSYPRDSYEVIVVDNGSEQDIKSIVDQFQQVRFSYEHQSGSYAARNKGIRIAQGSIFAFTDSDCIPDVYWIENGVRALLAAPQAGLVAGRIDIFFAKPDAPTTVELYEQVSAFPQKIYLEQKRFAATANLFTYRHIFEKVGYFNDQLRSGGDQEWGRRVDQGGYALVYADDVCVKHPARTSIAQLHQKIVRQTSGLLDIDVLKQQEGDYVPIKSYLNWIAFVIPSPRITYSIIRAKHIKGFKKLEVLLLMLQVKFIRLYELIRLGLRLRQKEYH